MRSLVIIVLLLSSLFIKGQITITNHSLTDTSQNIFYIGVDNLIKISGEPYKPSERMMTMTGGGGTMSGVGSTYVVRVQKETDDCNITIYVNRKPIFKKDFKVRGVGDIVARYVGVKDSTATIHQLLANPFIFIDIPGSYYKHNFQITSFSAIFISHEMDSLKTYTVGNLLTSETKEVIKKLNTGDKIFFDQIYTFGHDSRRRKLSPFTITIK